MKGQVSLETVRPILNKAFPQGIRIDSFEPMKVGMTNDSYVFHCDEGAFILRLPGAGSEALIDRKQEHQVYQLLAGKGITDEVIFFDPQSGVRITRFIPGARVCDPNSTADIEQFVRVLQGFHNLRLQVEHEFDPWERLEYYESLLEGKPSRYDDYPALKQQIKQIYDWTKQQPRDIVLAHIDPVADNFLLTETGDTYLIDWEYAAMQDRDIDIAMFAVYSLLNKEQIDQLIEIYQGDQPDRRQKKKIYAYIAIMGLVWSNWSEFQLKSGQDLGEYAIGQYRFAKEYSAYFETFDEPRQTRAIIMAAGMSSRFVPNSFEYPKGLTIVKGEVLVERQIRQLREAGITDITLVTGYMAEAFNYLAQEGIRLIHNPDYLTRNNHSSLYYAGRYLPDCLICSADNYFRYNPFFYESDQSYYSSVFVSGETDEWVIETDDSSRITAVNIGGSDGWVMLGHAYFNQDFGRRFYSILQDEYANAATKPKFWENLLIEHLAELPMVIRRYPAGYIFEFDSLDELRRFDHSYCTEPNSVILAQIARVLNRSPKKLHHFYPITESNRAIGFGFKRGKKKYVYLVTEDRLFKKKAYKQYRQNQTN